MLGNNGTTGVAGGTNVNANRAAEHLLGTTEPIVNASVNGGSSVPLLVDTGSTGLVIPLKDIGLQHLGLPTGIGMGAYSGGDTYIYLKFNGTINFGNGIVTSPTTVDAVFFSFPRSFSSFASSDGAVGILGVGTNTAGPNPSSPTHGVARQPRSRCAHRRARQTAGVRAQPGTVLATRERRVRSPDLTYAVTNPGSTSITSTNPTIVDAGGVYGTILQSALPGGTSSVPNGTNIAVSYDGIPLYNYSVNSTNAPTVITSGSQNTGSEPFSQMPIYVDYTNDTLVFRSGIVPVKVV